jgi:predicted dehydrogenase
MLRPPRGMKCGLVGPGYWAQGTHAVALAREPVVDFAGVWGREIPAGLQSLPRNSGSASTPRTS